MVYDLKSSLNANRFTQLERRIPGSTSPVVLATLIDNEISKERLNEIQKYLFIHQINKNKSFEGKSVEVLVENRIQNQLKLFGRNKYNNSVIFLGDENNIGKVVKVKIESTNQNSLFGKIENSKDMKAA